MRLGGINQSADSVSLLASAHDAAHTERVSGLSLDTWVSLGTLIGVGVSIATITLRSSRSLREEMRDLRADLKTDIHGLDGRLDKLDERLTERIDKLDERIDRLDDRVYALAVGLRPALERASETQSEP